MQSEQMEIDDQSDQMYLDEEAIRALDIVESKRQSNRTGKSLYSVLNRCKTVGGRNLLTDWIEHPLINIDAINRRLDIVECLFSNNQFRNDIGENLTKLPDLKRLTAKLSSKKCDLMDCCKIYQSFFFIKKLIDILDSEPNELINEEFVIKLKEMHVKCSNYANLIEETVDLESLENGDPLIDAKYDESLASLAEQMSNAKSKAEKVFSSIARELNLDDGKSIKLETCPQNGYVARITRKNDKVIRGNKKYRVIGTKKDGVRFTTDDLEKSSSKYIDLRKDYEEIQISILEKILDTLRTYCRPLENLNEILSRLDVFYALADTANFSSQSYVRPKLLPKESGKIKITNLRHPCLENLINVYYIPNSIHFDKEDKKFFIVTGPNMGGKSTFLRSIGIAVLLAQIGSFVPADDAEISIVDAIFTRVGASDKQFMGVSTFKAEMLETSEILSKATENSLVIIDELGRGTSTFDGYGLAYSISKEVATKIKSYCLFATHFHELTQLSKEIDTVDNLFVNYQFDEQNCNLKMLYQVQKGVCDQKFGIHVAKMVQFPDEMIEFAQNLVRKFEQVENPSNKELLDKISNLIKEKNKEINMNDLNDDELLSVLEKITSDAQ